MAGSRCRATARKNEFLESRQVLVKAIEIRLQAIDKVRGNGAVPRNAEFAAEFEQVVLDRSTVPYASTRALSFGVRLPSPRPVVPSSPVRV